MGREIPPRSCVLRVKVTRLITRVAEFRKRFYIEKIAACVCFSGEKMHLVEMSVVCKIEDMCVGLRIRWDQLLLFEFYKNFHLRYFFQIFRENGLIRLRSKLQSVSIEA